MAWVSPKYLPIVHAFYNLSRSSQDTVIRENRESGMDSAAGLAVNLATHERESARIYELPGPAYRAIRDVRQRLGADIASIVESVIAGETNKLYGLTRDDEQQVRSLVGVHNVMLP